MQTDLWFESWQQGKIGFHLHQPNPWLLRYYDELKSAHRILVPLCGKTVDLKWLAERGHHVVGIEVVPQAVEAFFAEQNLPFTREGTRYRADHLDIFCADIFSLGLEQLGGPFDAIWDRAASIALEPEVRPAYARTTSSWLKPGGKRLLVTVEYDTAKMSPPPHVIPKDEVKQLYGADIQPLTSEDTIHDPANARFIERGLSSFLEHVWLAKA